MKIRIPFKLFGKQEGEIELDFPVSEYYNVAKNREEIEKEAEKDAERAARYLGKFRDVFQRIILGYERVPGIENVYQTLKLCDKDQVLRERIHDLKKQEYAKRVREAGERYEKNKKAKAGEKA